MQIGHTRYFIITDSGVWRKVYIFAGGSWSQTHDLPVDRRQHAAVGISDTEIMFCGGAAAGIFSDCWLHQHDTGSYQQKASLNEPKWGHSLGLAYLADGTK